MSPLPRVAVRQQATSGRDDRSPATWGHGGQTRLVTARCVAHAPDAAAL